MTKVFLGVLLATVILAGGVPADAQDKATIDRLNESFAAAFNTGDIATVAAMFSCCRPVLL